MALLLNNGIFHEFIPFNNTNFDSEGNIIGKPSTLTVEEIKEGVEYALVISTNAGAWRYLIGDTVRFTDTKKCELVITGRTKHFLSVCGEHLSVGNMNQGIQQLQETLNTIVREFTVSAVKRQDYFTHKWYIGCEPMVDAETAASILDARLKGINDDYATERTAVLKNIEVQIIAPQIFYDFMRNKGKMGGQAKFPRVMKAELFAEWELFVATENTKNTQLTH